jgi:hypothetical protein
MIPLQIWYVSYRYHCTTNSNAAEKWGVENAPKHQSTTKFIRNQQLIWKVIIIRHPIWDLVFSLFPFSSSSFHVCAWDTLEPWALTLGDKRFLDQILREEVGNYFTLVQIFLCFFTLGVWLKNDFAISFYILELFAKSPCLWVGFHPHPLFQTSFRGIHKVRKLY